MQHPKFPFDIHNCFGIIVVVAVPGLSRTHDDETWLSLVERLLREQEVAGSNPVVSITTKPRAAGVNASAALLPSVFLHGK